MFQSRRCKMFLRIALILLLVLTPLSSFGAHLYVQSIKAPLLSEPRLGAPQIAEPQRGEVLEIIEKKDNWYLVKYKELKGWVSRLLVDIKPPKEKVSVLEETGQKLEEGARKRASAYVTAASARGLMEERSRLSDRYRVNFEDLEWIEAIKISDLEASRFLEEGLRK